MGSTNNYQPAHSGNSYCDFVVLNSSPLAGNYGGKRHYLQTKLTDSLIKDKKYSCGFYVALSNGANYGCNNVAMVISKNALSVDTAVVKNWVINANPQIYNYGNPIIKDTQNWTLVQSTFIAQGGEQYITIGNFKDNANTSIDRYLPPDVYDWAVYALDDVFVYELNNSYCLQANAGRDTTIAVGDSVFIGSYTNDIDTIKWFNGSWQLIDSTRPGFWVKPTTAGTYMYIVQQTVNGCTSADTVWVNVNSLPLNFISYSVISNVVRNLEKSVENIWITANEINVSHYNIERSTNAKDFTTIGKVKAINKNYNEYNFTDLLTTNYSLLTTLYYRVVGVDFDGKKTYSTVKSLQLKVNSAVSVYPNPAKDVVHIVASNIKEVKLFDMFGREIATGTNLRNDGSNNYQLNISSLPKGIYILNVISKLNSVYNEKLIVQ